MRHSHIVISIVVFVVLLLSYLRPVYKNRVSFLTDEMYWISTANVVHMLASWDTKNPLWHEYYGFTNFNGAKYAYGIGLSLLGHMDVSAVGVAPATYYRWISFEPEAFPERHPNFALLRDARVISAVFTAAAATLIYILGINIRLSVVSAIAAAVIFGIHPITRFVATHAFSDGILLFFQMMLLTALFGKQTKQKGLTREILIGIALGALVSVKLNGLMFIPIILFLALPGVQHLTGVTTPQTNYFFRMGVLIAAASLTVLFLHPNFFFYPGYPPAQMLRDRVQITTEHIAYFSQNNSSHVILEPMERVASFLRHGFPFWMSILILLGVAASAIPILYKKTVNYPYFLYVAGGITVLLSVLSYCVFDEQRYYLPVIPFMAVIASYPFTVIFSGRLFKK